jgi:hypothetical protein
MPTYLRYRRGYIRRFPDTVPFAQLREPREPAAAAARSSLGTIAPAYLVNHSVRTYWFSRFIGMAVGLDDIDDELLYVASLAHDVGLLPDYADQPGDAKCFSIRSATWAVGVVAGFPGWGSERTARLKEAIILNLNGRVARRRGTEAHLMMRGVLADLTGVHGWLISPRTRSDVYAALPPLEQRPDLARLFTAEGDRHPNCRGHFVDHRLGFGLLMRHAPPPPLAG